MDNIFNALKELNEKYKRNSKLSSADADTMVALTVELLNNEGDWEKGFDIIMNGSADAGMQAYYRYYMTLDKKDKIRFNNEFVKNEQFVKNSQNKSVYRYSILLGKIIENKGTAGEALFMIRQLCKLLFANGKKEISSQNLKYIQEEVISKCDMRLNSLDISKYDISERDMYLIQRIFVNSALIQSNKYEVPFFNQYTVLKWLSQAGSTVAIEKNEELLLEKAYANWPDEIKSAFEQDPEMADMYGKYVAAQGTGNTEKEMKVEDNSSQKEGALVKATNDTDRIEKQAVNEVVTDTPAASQVPNAKELVSMLGKRIEDYELAAEAREKALKDAELELRMKQTKLDNLERNIQNLKYDLENNVIRIKTLQDEADSLKLTLSKKDDEIEKLRISEQEHKKNIEILYGVGAKEDNSQLVEFKNKLAGRLRYDYINFKEIEFIDMTAEIGENIRIQLMNLFNELKRQGIRLE